LGEAHGEFEVVDDPQPGQLPTGGRSAGVSGTSGKLGAGAATGAVGEPLALGVPLTVGPGSAPVGDALGAVVEPAVGWAVPVGVAVGGSGRPRSARKPAIGANAAAFSCLQAGEAAKFQASTKDAAVTGSPLPKNQPLRTRTR
jgi:hypothetical protein